MGDSLKNIGCLKIKLTNGWQACLMFRLNMSFNTAGKGSTVVTLVTLVLDSFKFDKISYRKRKMRYEEIKRDLNGSGKPASCLDSI